MLPQLKFISAASFFFLGKTEMLPRRTEAGEEGMQEGEKANMCRVCVCVCVCVCVYVCARVAQRFS